jgi:hypothetical protein
MNSSDSPTPGVSPPEERIDVDKLVGQFVALRDRKREMEAQHKDSLKPFNELIDTISSKLLAHMDRTGTTSLTTPSGNAHRTTKKSATIKDAGAFREFVKSTGNFDLVDWRANANAVFDFIKESNGVSPPGVNASTYTSIGVRRPNDKAED